MAYKKWLSLALLGLLLAAPAARAKPTARFDVASFEALDRGEPRGTLVSSEGEVTAGREAKRLKLKAAMVWTSVQAPDGTVYFGSGADGVIYAVKGEAVRKVAELKAVLVTALALGPGGSLLAGTMPEARIVRVDPKSGAQKELAKLPTEHVWALLHEPRARRIYAASGAPGKLFAVPEGGGDPQVYYDPKEKHLLCLARADKGDILVGSAPKAILYRVFGKGRAVALHDFEGTELKAIVRGPKGALYAAVNAFTRKTGGLPRYTKKKAGGGTAIDAKKNKGKNKKKVAAKDLRPGAKSGKGGVFRLDSDGAAEQLHGLNKGYFTALALDRAGVLWAAEGSQGKVFRIQADEQVVQTALDLPERQVLTLALAGETLYLGTGDAGALYRVAPGPAAQPRYLSKVFDAKVPSRWGLLHLHTTAGALVVESRSGNTAEPDRTWHPWKRARAAGDERLRLLSPAARYLQLRFTWPRGGKGALRSFSTFFRPHNLRARVSEIEVKREQDKDEPRSTTLKVSWKVENPDGDTLVHRLYLRPEGGTLWRQLGGPDPLDKAKFDWQTEAVPDGYYRLKVVTSDEADNPAESTRRHERISERILVDNRKPEITGLKAAWPWVSGVARDSQSPITRLEYTLNGRVWRLAVPQDGIFDSSSEPFRFRLVWDGLPPGDFPLAVRVTDDAGNVGVAQTTLRKAK